MESSPSKNTPDRRDGRKLMVLLSLGIIVFGVIGAVTLIRTTPTASRRPPAKMSPLVRVQSVYPDRQQIVIEAMGTVVPAREMVLKARVSGQIVDIHAEFSPGGVLNKGEKVLQIDDVDYRLILAQKESAVVDARYALKLELGRQAVAQREWKLLNGDNPAPNEDAELALRKPHLEKARSDLAAAEAELEQARLQLERTRIYAPFNAVIRQTHVEKGSQVASQENLATIVGTDVYWVQASIPVDRLKWIAIPRDHGRPGAEVRITYHDSAERSGLVIKLLSDLESEGRMARLLIAVQDPLGLQSQEGQNPALLIGEYVHVGIKGRQIESAYEIPRSALRDNTYIWIANRDGRLDIRKINTLWRDRETVLFKGGVQSGEKLIVSDLPAPIPGMPLTVEEQGAAGGSEQQASSSIQG